MLDATGREAGTRARCAAPDAGVSRISTLDGGPGIAALYEYPFSPDDLHTHRRALSGSVEFATKLDRGSDSTLWVNRERARYSTWYELFPRSTSPVPGKHGTLLQMWKSQLPEISAMGFDVLYLPPIHPIGTAYRKGKNNNDNGTARRGPRQPLGDWRRWQPGTMRAGT